MLRTRAHSTQLAFTEDRVGSGDVQPRHGSARGGGAARRGPIVAGTLSEGEGERKGEHQGRGGCVM